MWANKAGIFLLTYYETKDVFLLGRNSNKLKKKKKKKKKTKNTVEKEYKPVRFIKI